MKVVSDNPALPHGLKQKLNSCLNDQLENRQSNSSPYIARSTTKIQPAFITEYEWSWNRQEVWSLTIRLPRRQTSVNNTAISRCEQKHFKVVQLERYTTPHAQLVFKMTPARPNQKIIDYLQPTLSAMDTILNSIGNSRSLVVSPKSTKTR